MSPPDPRSLCAGQLPAGLLNEDEPVFAEPWQAQAFAMAVSLIEQGQISWSRWAETLGEEIKNAGQLGIAEDGSGYYELWLRALERLVLEEEMVAENELGELRSAWRTAYSETPHGEPVSL